MTEQSCCQEEFAELEHQLDEINVKLKEKKDVYQKALVENLKKDLQIGELEKKIESSLYSEFKPYFSEYNLNRLRHTDISSKFDSKFISIAMDGLYSGNPDILSKKTVSGRSNNNKKEAVSPEKKEILENLFSKRLDKVPAKECNERSRNLNKLIKNKIDNVAKK